MITLSDVLIFVMICFLIADIVVNIKVIKEIQFYRRDRDSQEINTTSDPLAITQSSDTRGLV